MTTNRDKHGNIRASLYDRFYITQPRLTFEETEELYNTKYKDNKYNHDLTECWPTHTPFTPEELDTTKKIASFGCSYTFCSGVPYTESYTHFLQQDIDNEYPDEYKVLNFGKPGISHDNIYRMICQYFNTPELSSNTDTIVINFTGSGRREYLKFHDDNIDPNADDIAFFSSTRKDIQIDHHTILIGHKLPHLKGTGINEAYTMISTTPNNLLTLEKFIQNVELLSAQKKVNVIFWWGCSDFPSRYTQEDKKYLLNVIQNVHNNREQWFSYIEADDEIIKARDNLSAVVSKKDVHFNKLGNQMVADRILKRFIALKGGEDV